MAIVVTTPAVEAGFIANATSADLSGCEELVAAQAGKFIKISHLSIQSVAAIAITIGAGETGGAVTAALLGPMEFAAGDFRQWQFFPSYLLLPSATALTIDADGAGACWIFIQGYIE